ncbi:MAG TPA: LysM peptidoglycan-binding domain-containing protein [Jatrophihabitans sp.]|jgi:LysM repeat protein|uniref:LysM peptidoglycan-binding domain-containing protein n=1 Tax=Jatrophihabitans sp. TaxID=1932789 RepID=UPI002F0908F4
MSVATEFPPAVFIPVRARRLPHPAAPADPATTPAGLPQLRLVQPAGRCAPASGSRVDGARRGGRGARSSVRLVKPASATASLPSIGVPAGQLAAAPLRLTRRGVVAIALGVAAVGGLLLLVAHLSAGSPTAPAVSVPSAVVTVQPGDTLWSIAGQVAPGRDPRQVVQSIRESNHLTSVSLSPGQTLKVG